MARSLCLLILAAVLVAVPAASAAADEAKPYIVVFEPSSAAGARAATADLAGDEHFKATQVYDDSLHGFAAKLDEHDAAAVEDDPRVKAVVPDRPASVASLVPLAAGDNVPNGVRRVGAAVDSTVHEASTANVAVIDTGVDLAHPDLNAVAGATCNGSGPPTDGNGHGTHVAGTIAARNQGGGGAVGVAPGTRIYAVRVLNAGGSGYMSNIICGIDWVTSTRTDRDPGNDIAVANMSLGGSGAMYGNCGRGVNDPEHLAICNSVAAGVTYVVAAGNSSRDEQTFVPANYPEVLTVTAETDTDGLPGGGGPRDPCYGSVDDIYAPYSNFATRATEIAHTISAPGTCIRSTYPGGRYATMSGTSMASPHVAGLVALCMGENGAHGPCWGQSPANVMQIVLAAAATTAAGAPDQAFNGSPLRNRAGRYYGPLASTAFPSDAGVTPKATAAPAISGTAAIGQTLTASTGAWSDTGATLTQQWLRCTSASGLDSCSAISGATGTTYQPGLADAGRYLHVRVVATNAEGAGMGISPTTAAVPVPVAPVAKVAPKILGMPQLTHTLSAQNGTWTGTAPISYSLKWQRCTSATNVATCADVAGATGPAYAPVDADAGRYLRLAQTATNVKGAVTARSAPVLVTRPAGTTSTGTTTATAPANTVLPSLLGVGAVTHTLTFKPGTWTGTAPSYAYAWQRCTSTALSSCLPIPGATGAGYLLTSADRGRYVRIAVTATNAKGSATARSNPIGPIG
jgi:subtilisin family serine protease